MKYFLTLLLLLPAFASFAQEPEEHLSLDEVRTQSGVDPTRIILSLIHISEPTRPY